jgi:DNA-binding GntR family transcriptional regulator
VRRQALQCREHLHLLDLPEHGSREDAAASLRRHLDVMRAIKVAACAAHRAAPVVPAQP